MDRTTALTILELVRPGTPDELESDVQEALRVVQDDPDAARLLALRRRADARIADAMNDVPVPADAKARLLAELTALSAPNDQPIDDQHTEDQRANDSRDTDQRAVDPRANHPPASPPRRDDPRADDPRVSRRRLGKRLVAACAALALLMLLAVALIGRFDFGARGGAMSVEELAAAAPHSEDTTPQFPESAPFTPALPSGSGWSRRVDFAPPQQVVLRGAASPRAAVLPFEVVVGRGQKVRGWLIIAPANRVAPPPAATSFAPDGARYSDGLASVSWIENDLVYVCVVRGGDDALRQIERALGVRLS